MTFVPSGSAYPGSARKLLGSILRQRVEVLVDDLPDPLHDGSRSAPQRRPPSAGGRRMSYPRPRLDRTERSLRTLQRAKVA